MPALLVILCLYARLCPVARGHAALVEAWHGPYEREKRLKHRDGPTDRSAVGGATSMGGRPPDQ